MEKKVSVLKLLWNTKFYKVLDTTDAQFTECFQQGGLLTLQKLENTLISGTIDLVVHDYPKMYAQLLEIQLTMFIHNYMYSSWWYQSPPLRQREALVLLDG